MGFSPQFQIHVQFFGTEPDIEPAGGITERSGIDRQFHCHDHVSGSSWEADGAADAACAPVGAAEVPAAVPVGAAAVDDVAADAGLAPAAAADAATFTCVTGPLSPGLPIRTLTLTLLGATWAAAATVAGVGVDGGTVAAIPPAVSAETGVVSGVEDACIGVVSTGGAAAAGGAVAGAAVESAAAGSVSPVACSAPPRASATTPATAALAAPSSIASASTDATGTGVSGTEAMPSPALASVGRVAAAALTSVAATTHVARRAVVIGVMHQHLCNLDPLFIHDFSTHCLDMRFATRYFDPDKGRWIWWGIGGCNVAGSGSTRPRRFSPPITTGATGRLERG
ncbi:MAG TPA: hypothetical protein VLK53_02500 [Gaiellaceae bacterium]|nr:hypothetical protein [Gaiellaceae bacterium]